jgi:integrase
MPAKKFTARNVMTLPPIGGKRTEYTDAEHEGFSMRVSADGRQCTYFVRYRKGPAVRRVKVDKVERISLADARDRAKVIWGQVADGQDPAAEKAAQRKADKAGAGSLTRLAERLIAEADLAKSTRRLWPWTLKKYIVPALGSRPLGSITRSDVRGLLASIESKHVAKNVRRLLSWIYARAMEDEENTGITASPCVRLGRMSKEAPRDRGLTHAELRAVWNAAGHSGAYGSAIRFLMLTGVRRGEAFNAVWSEFDLEANVWRIPAARSKNGRPHDVPLSQEARDVLDALPSDADDPRLLPVTPGHKFWVTLLVKAGIIDEPEESDDRRGWTAHPVGLHDLRRTLRNSLTAHLDVNIAVAEAVLGHTQTPLIRTYAPDGVSLRDVRTALDRWAAELRAIVSGKRAGKVRQMPRRRGGAPRNLAAVYRTRPESLEDVG